MQVQAGGLGSKTGVYGRVVKEEVTIYVWLHVRAGNGWDLENMMSERDRRGMIRKDDEQRV